MNEIKLIAERDTDGHYNIYDSNNREDGAHGSLYFSDGILNISIVGLNDNFDIQSSITGYETEDEILKQVCDLYNITIKDSWIGYSSNEEDFNHDNTHDVLEDVYSIGEINVGDIVEILECEFQRVGVSRIIPPCMGSLTLEQAYENYPHDSTYDWIEVVESNKELLKELDTSIREALTDTVRDVLRRHGNLPTFMEPVGYTKSLKFKTTGMNADGDPTWEIVEDSD